MVRPRAATVPPTLSTPAVFLVAAACTGSPASSPAASTQATAAPPASASPAASASSASSSPGASASVAPSASASEGASAGASEGVSGATGSALALQAKEFSYSGPATATAGVTTITLQNTGKETHQAQLVKLNTGKTFNDLTTA